MITRIEEAECHVFVHVLVYFQTLCTGDTHKKNEQYEQHIDNRSDLKFRLPFTASCTGHDPFGLFLSLILDLEISSPSRWPITD